MVYRLLKTEHRSFREKCCLNIHYLAKPDSGFSFTYFYLLVQDPVPFYQPISFTTTQSQRAGPNQPAFPCGAGIRRACIWKDAGKALVETTPPPQEDWRPDVLTAHLQASLQSAPDGANMGNRRHNFVTQKRHFDSFLLFRNISRLVMPGRS